MPADSLLLINVDEDHTLLLLCSIYFTTLLYLAQAGKDLPADGMLLIIADENLDLAWPLHETISGSAAIKRALDQLGPEVRLHESTTIPL